MDNDPRFSIEELEAIETDARDSLFGASDRWTPTVIDLCRALRHEMDV